MYKLNILVMCNSCNIDMNDLPDMYRPKGIHKRQITSAFVTTDM